MKMLKNGGLLLVLVLTLLFTPPVVAQTTAPAGESVLVEVNPDNTEVEMADQFRKDGKIYIVIVCVLVVLVGVLIYLISIDRKVSNLEKQYKS